jgi:fatty-acyl-CoA synthase
MVIGEPINTEEMQRFQITLGDMLDQTVRQEGQREALVFSEHGLRLTYSEFGSLVDQAAKGLMALGIQKGEHIALWSPNNPYWLYIQYAAAKVGAILVTVNTYFKASEVEYVLRQSDSTTLFLASGFRDVDYLAVLESICPELAETELGALVSPRLPALRRVVFLGEEPRRGLLPFQELLNLGRTIPDSLLAERQQGQRHDDTVTLVYTSGTTGFPKGSLLGHSALVGISYWVGRELDYKPSDRSCQPAPLFSVGGMIGGSIIPVYFGATILGLNSFDPVAVMKMVQDEGCTVLYGVPTMFIAILDHPDFSKYNMDSLERAYLAGSPCPIELMKEIEARLQMRAIIGCGLTETSGTPLITRMEDPPEIRLATVGRPMPGIEIKVVDPESGESLPPGQQGELCYRGWTLMKGYYNMPEATGAAVDQEGWLHSGDLATINERGYVNITGRIKDMIIRGGQNIYAREIEEYLHAHPKVSDAYVVGVPDRKYGEELLACIKLKVGERCTQEEIQGYCRKGLARFKVPKYVMFLESFPMTAVGKVQKFKLVEMGIAHFGLERESLGPTA